MRITAIDHVQLAMPPGGEAQARSFYGDILGLPERPKPAQPAGRGAVWFERGEIKLHIGVDNEFRPARKAHVALIVEELSVLAARLKAAGFPVIDDPLPDRTRFYTEDPFGNRIELLEPERPDQVERER
jgi:catechol 2,3-dioxygenase-like lactoylglutathione lyase family enzyme